MNSDFKNNRVADPTKISDKQIKQVKKYCKEYFDKAVSKHRAHDQKKQKQERKSKESHSHRPSSSSADRPDKEEQPKADSDVKKEEESDGDVDLSDDDMPGFKVSSSPREGSSAAEPLKRKRSPDDEREGTAEMAADDANHSPKRQKSTSPQHLPPPPPPPPPMTPGDVSPNDVSDMSLKRKRSEENGENGDYEDGAGSMSPGKRHRNGETPPPPPPPPPPADIMDTSNSQEDIEGHQRSEEPWSQKGDGDDVDGDSAIRGKMSGDSNGNDTLKHPHQNGKLHSDEEVSNSQPLSPLHNNISTDNEQV